MDISELQRIYAGHPNTKGRYVRLSIDRCTATYV